MPRLKRRLSWWERFTLVCCLAPSIVSLGLALASFADGILGLGWGYTWIEFWGSLGLFAGSIPFGLFVMMVQGLFASDEAGTAEQVRAKAEALSPNDGP